MLSGVDPGLDFNAHYYGPYSSALDSTVAQLKNLGFISEEITGFGVSSEGFELRRYDYSLTSDGQKLLASLRGSKEYQKVASAVERITEAGNPDYFELAIAAKTFFILDRKEKPMSHSEIQREAERSFNWNIQPQSLEKAVKFLRHIELTESTKREKAG